MLIPTIKESEKLRELFAEIEHEQWIAWSKNIAETENITPAIRIKDIKGDKIIVKVKVRDFN